MIARSDRTRSLFLQEDGATAVEYAIMAALIAGVCVVAVGALGVKVDDLFTAVIWW